MKKLLLSVFVAFAAMMSASAQYAAAPEYFAKNPDQVLPGFKYSQLKNLYNPKDAVYLADPEYGTGRAWLNLLVPSLAQFTMGEGGLGAKYLGLAILGDAIASVAYHDYYMYETHDDDVYKGIFPYNQSLIYGMIGGAAISVCSCIFSIINAQKVAKVKSLYDYDLKKLGRQVSFETMPFIAPVRVGDKVQPAAGVTFAMQF